MDVEQIRVLKEKRYGWVRADGTLVACGLFEHFKVLEGEATLADAYRKYSEIIESNAEMMEADLQSLEPDEHPAMHRFDGMDDDAKRDMAIAVYEAGWIRLGMRLNNMTCTSFDRRAMRGWGQNPDNWFLEAEGFETPLHDHRKALKDLALIMAARLEVRPMVVAKVRMGSKRSKQFSLMLVTKDIYTRLADHGELI